MMHAQQRHLYTDLRPHVDEIFANRKGAAAYVRCCAPQVRKLFGVKSSLFGALPGRVTYVIDKSGAIRHSFNSQLQFAKHSKEAMEAVKALA